VLCQGVSALRTQVAALLIGRITACAAVVDYCTIPLGAVQPAAIPTFSPLRDFPQYQGERDLV
jgi:hypothetical protein